MCARILVIEPDKTLRELTALVLAGLGHQPSFEATGDRALGATIAAVLAGRQAPIHP